MLCYEDQLLLEKSNRLGKDAVGKSFTIKLAESGRANKVTVTGIIVECGFGYFKRTSSKVSVVFKVVMECGPNKVRREFHVLKVPS